MTKQESKELKAMWRALAKVVTPAKLSEKEQHRLYRLALDQRGASGWTS